MVDGIDGIAPPAAHPTEDKNERQEGWLSNVWENVSGAVDEFLPHAGDYITSKPQGAIALGSIFLMGIGSLLGRLKKVGKIFTPLKSIGKFIGLPTALLLHAIDAYNSYNDFEAEEKKENANQDDISKMHGKMWITAGLPLITPLVLLIAKSLPLVGTVLASVTPLSLIFAGMTIGMIAATMLSTNDDVCTGASLAMTNVSHAIAHLIEAHNKLRNQN